MDVMEASIVHHLALVLAALWIAVSLGYSNSLFFFLALFYLYVVNERYSVRLQKRLQYEERKCANQRRLLSDTESVRWLNHAIERIWPLCMERIVSQQFLLPIIPWFLDKFKPWTARKAVVQHLYLGRNPPMFTDMRVISQSTDDHLVLELGLSFLAAEDMNVVLAVQLRKRVGFGITANMHLTGMHIEGKVLVGIKFLRNWPFLGRIRVCFVEPPYFQMTVKPMFSHGFNVTEIPGISGWLDKLLDVAFGQTLVEPNMLVIDAEKFASKPAEGWFTIDEKHPIAYVQLEILEGADMKPSDPNGLADPYVKGRLGPYRFQTKIHWKTLYPKFREEFKIPITSWEAPNVLALQVRDKDPIFDDMLGDCSIDINILRGGQRHDKWLSLKNIKMGRLHVAVTILEDESEKGNKDLNGNKGTQEDATETISPTQFSAGANEDTSDSQKGYQKMADEYEPINLEGHGTTEAWVHHPGSDVSQTWEPRKGRERYPEAQVHRESDGHRYSSSSSSASGSGKDEAGHGSKRNRIKRGLDKIGTVFQRTPRQGNLKDNSDELPTPRPNLHPLGEKRISIKLVVDEDFAGGSGGHKPDQEPCSFETAELESPGRGHLRSKAKDMAKQAAGKSAKSLKSIFSWKGLDKMKEDQLSPTNENDATHDPNPSSYAARHDPFIVGGSLVDARPSSMDHNKELNPTGGAMEPESSAGDDRFCKSEEVKSGDEANK